MYKISELDTYLFNEGLMEEAYKIFGSHIVCEDGVWGVRFTVYAPHARIISVIGDFNNWDSRTCVLEKVDDMGIYSKFVPGIGEWTKYKYMIVTQNGDTIYKADPYGYFSDLRPESCTKVYDIDHYEWHDQEYLNKRKKRNHKEEPIAIYEMNLGSWRKKDNGEFYKYNELVDILIPYLKDMGFNYVEFMPIYEYPLDESWGYQGTGYYSATSRFGVPKDLMYLIDKLHEADIKVIFDWVPGHTCKDPQGLYMFDGAPVYEYADPRIRENEVWGTLNMDLGKGIVRSFFLSNAKFFMEYFHVDGFRLDAVSNIFYYLGDSRNGTNEGGVEFLKRLNGVVKRYDPNVILCAEDSTTFPNVTKDPYFWWSRI